MQFLIIVLACSTLFIKGKKLFKEIKEKNTGGIKGELTLFILILVIHISLFFLLS